MQQSAAKKRMPETLSKQDFLIDAACKSYPLAPLPSEFTSRVLQQLPAQQRRSTMNTHWRLQAADIVLICFFTIFVLTLPLVLFWMTQLPTAGWPWANSNQATLVMAQWWSAWPVWTVIAATFGGLLICAGFVALTLPPQLKFTHK